MLIASHMGLCQVPLAFGCMVHQARTSQLNIAHGRVPLQDETTQGVVEVVRNVNYCHSLTVLYHEVLRHVRVDTRLANVRVRDSSAAKAFPDLSFLGSGPRP